jgi:iron complex transport system substrate-binding protein
VYLPAPDFYISAGGVQSLERVLATITEAFAVAH